jgi:hypothetical protein
VPKPLGVGLADAPAHSTLTALDADAGTVVYTGDAGYSGVDRFTYRSSSTSGPADAVSFALDVKPRPALTATSSGDVVLGGAVSATATVAGRFEAQPGSTVTFHLHADAACVGEPVFTSAPAPDDAGVAASGAFTPNSLTIATNAIPDGTVMRLIVWRSA